MMSLLVKLAAANMYPRLEHRGGVVRELDLRPKVTVAPIRKCKEEPMCVNEATSSINCEDDDLFKSIDRSKSKRPKLSDYDQATQT